MLEDKSHLEKCSHCYTVYMCNYVKEELLSQLKLKTVVVIRG